MREQLLVRAALDDLAALEHQNLIGAANRRQPVRDDERRAAADAATAGRPESSISLSLSRLDVASSSSRTRGLARIARAMATRCRWPPDSRTPRSPTTVSYPFSNASMNSSACAMRLTRCDVRARRVRRAVRDVLGDRAVEQEVVLQHDAQVPAVVAEPQRQQIAAVHAAARPCCRPVERHHQADERALARSRRPDQRGRRAGRAP